MVINLNSVDPVDDGFLKFDDNKIENQVASVSCYFRDFKTEIIENINKADAIFGCVAWLSHAEIIDALLKKENVSIVVSHKSKPTKSNIKLACKNNWIKLNHLERKDNHFFTFLNMMSVSVDEPSYNDTIDSLRKLVPKETIVQSQSVVDGNEQTEDPYEALMHNKFLVFAKVSFTKDILQEASNGYYANVLGASQMSPEEYVRSYCAPTITPYAVWTGSYNFTSHTDNHLENGVCISNVDIAGHYLNEFMQIYMLSRVFDY